jgi:hypothetical protein
MRTGDLRGSNNAVEEGSVGGSLMRSTHSGTGKTFSVGKLIFSGLLTRAGQKKVDNGAVGGHAR